MKSLMAIVVVVSFHAAAGNLQITLPFNSARASEGRELRYVDDAAAAAALPWLKNAGNRLSTCFSTMTMPEQLYVAYVPDITGEHTGKQKVLHCEHMRGSEKLTCDSSRVDATVYFDKTPNQYFSLDPNIDLNEVIPFIHALLTHQLRFAQGVPDQHLGDENGHVGTISKQGNQLRLTFGNCNGGGSMAVERKQDSTGHWFYEAVSSGWQFMF